MHHFLGPDSDRAGAGTPDVVSLRRDDGSQEAERGRLELQSCIARAESLDRQSESWRCGPERTLFDLVVVWILLNGLLHS